MKDPKAIERGKIATQVKVAKRAAFPFARGDRVQVRSDYMVMNCYDGPKYHAGEWRPSRYRGMVGKVVALNVPEGEAKVKLDGYGGRESWMDIKSLIMFGDGDGDDFVEEGEEDDIILEDDEDEILDDEDEILDDDDDFEEE